jgi:hypothetical protein
MLNENINDDIELDLDVELDEEELLKSIGAKNWKDLCKELCENSPIKESEILYNMPPSYHSKWDEYMRGKTCPILDNGEHGVYNWDLEQFLQRV